MASAMLRVLRGRCNLSSLPGKVSLPCGASPLVGKWASLVRPFSLKPPVNDTISKDLGTTASCVSVMEEGEVVQTSKVKENCKGVTNPTSTHFWTKRLIDRQCENFKLMELIRQPDLFVFVRVKEIAKSYLGIPAAVIIVPTSFDDEMCQLTKDRARMVGLDVQMIINETALAYGLYDKGAFAVLDLAGAVGTYNVWILKISNGVFEIKATKNSICLHGEDFDHALVEFLVDEFKRSETIDLSNNILALQRLREAAEKAKIELSSVFQTKINIPCITLDSSRAKYMNITLTRSKFETLVKQVLERIRNPPKSQKVEDEVSKIFKNCEVAIVQVFHIVTFTARMRRRRQRQRAEDIIDRLLFVGWELIDALDTPKERDDKLKEFRNYLGRLHELYKSVKMHVDWHYELRKLEYCFYCLGRLDKKRKE